jgi:hypothetical protein
MAESQASRGCLLLPSAQRKRSSGASTRTAASRQRCCGWRTSFAASAPALPQTRLFTYTSALMTPGRLGLSLNRCSISHITAAAHFHCWPQRSAIQLLPSDIVGFHLAPCCWQDFKQRTPQAQAAWYISTEVDPKRARANRSYSPKTNSTSCGQLFSHAHPCP